MTQIWKAKFTLPSAHIESVEPYLWEAFENISFYRHDGDETKHNVEVIYEGDQNQESIEQKLSLICTNTNINAPIVSFEKIPDINWLQHVYKEYPPLVAGRFFVHGGHVTNYPQDKIEISLNAATAFGTGEHGTTKGCLLALDVLFEKHSFENPIDMGCGAGVLSIAAAKFLKKKIIAIDNDAEAVRVVVKNADINNVSNYIDAECGDGFKAGLAIKSAPYDLIMANILAGPLIDMAPDIKKFSDASGFVILSGVLQTQENKVLSIYQSLGFSVIEKYPIDEWQTIVLRNTND